MPKFILEVYEHCDQRLEGARWANHHCDGTYDDSLKLGEAIHEALVDPVIQCIKVRLEET